MRYRIRGNVMHRTLFLSLCWWLVFDSTFSTGEARTPRRRSTTEGTSTSTTTSTTTTTTEKPFTVTHPQTRKVRRRTRVLQKRYGGAAAAAQDLGGDYEDELDREPLYDAPTVSDELQYEPPAHYYSPSKTQKQRKKLRAHLNQGQDRRIAHNAPTGPSQYLRSSDYSRPSEYSGPPLYSGPTKYSSPTQHPQHFEDAFPQQPAPKNYAFAYAVRDDNNAEDFSHKEARDGKLTMGEYRINLPDGRVQIVRYTAGGTLGYKADVTYEGDDPRNKELTKPERPKNVDPSPGPPYYSSPTSAVHKKYAPSPGPTHFDSPESTKGYEEDPVYLSRPLKSRRPSLSPSSTYSGYSGGSQDYPLTGSASPSPTFDYKAGPQRIRGAPPTLPSYYNDFSSSTGRPKSIYDKMPRKKKPKYTGNLSFLHEQSPRAGPARSKKFNYNQEIEASQSRENSYPTQQPQSSYDGPLKYYSSGPKPSSSPRPSSGSSGYKFRGKPLKPRTSKPRYYQDDQPRPSKPSYFQDNQSQVGPSPFIQINPTQSGNPGNLIPIEHFKAGPSKKRLRRPKNKPSYVEPQDDHSYPTSVPISQTPTYRDQKPPNGQQNYQPTFNSPSSVTYQEPYHYYNSQHAGYHHGGYVEPTQPPHNSGGYVQNQLSSTGSSYEIDYPGGKHSFYLKTSSGKPKPGRLGRKKTSSGLVYLETPGEGLRPTAQGVGEAMSRLPNMPPPQTSIHPYEIGSKDYGNSVGYKNSGGGGDGGGNGNDEGGGPYGHGNQDFRGEYAPHLNTNQFEIDHHYEQDHDHRQDSFNTYNRDYLIDNQQDSIVQVPLQSSSTEGVENPSDAAFQFDVK